MNKIKLHLYRHCPRIVQNSIRKMISEYRNNKGLYSFRDVDEEIEETTLEKILPDVLTEEFFEFLYKDCYFRLNLRDYYPPALLNNQEFVDLVIKYDPMSILDIPNHNLLKKEHVDILDDFFISNPNHFISHRKLPKILTESERVFEIVLEGFFNKPDYIESRFFELLNLYCDKPDFYRKLIERHKAGNYPVDHNYYVEDNSFLMVDEIIDYLVKRDYILISLVPESKRDVAVKSIADLIKEKYIYISGYSTDPWMEILTKSKVIIDAMFSSKDFSDYMEFFKRTYADLYTEEQALRIFEENEKNDTYYLPICYSGSPAFLLAFLKFNNRKLFNYERFNSFDSVAFDENVLNYLLDHLYEFPSYVYGIISDKVKENEKFVKPFLSKYKNELINNEQFNSNDFNEAQICAQLFKNINTVDDAYLEDYLDVIGLLVEKDKFYYDVFSSRLWFDEKFMRAFSERGYLDIIVDEVFYSQQDYFYNNSYYSATTNTEFIKKYIAKCKNAVINGFRIYSSLSFLKEFDKNKINDPEIMDMLLEFVDVLVEKNLFSGVDLPEVIYQSTDVLKKILSEDVPIRLLVRFEVTAFEDPEAVYLLFRKLTYKQFYSIFRRIDRFDYAFENLKINSVEEFNLFFDNLNKHYDLSLAMLLVVKYKESGLNDENLNQLCEYYTTRVKEDLSKNYSSANYADSFITKVLKGERNPFTLAFIEDNVSLCVAANYCDFLNVVEVQQLSEELMFLYQNVNKKHVNDIIKFLGRFDNLTDYQKFDLALKMYVAIGYNRSKDLLNTNVNKSYGNISIMTLNTLFNGIDLHSIVLEQQGKGFVIEENQVLINLLFGSNYKDKSTPIFHYLNNFDEKNKQVESKVAEIEAREDLTPGEKSNMITDLRNSFNDYRNQVKKFVEKFSSLFNQWDIVEEEFLKKQNKSKLELKLNVSVANSILRSINSGRTTPSLELRDDPLVITDVFDYVGKDTQFTTNPEQAPARAIELSRRMDSVTSKKFPNIKLEQNGYTLFVYSPHDRCILSAGFRSGCCFRPNGNADNSGSDDSLLNYCVSTEYGGGVEIVDKDGKTVMFSPLLRNGNVLMIHSIETLVSTNAEHMQNVHELLVEFSKKCVEESYKCGDAIDFVTVTDLHYLDNKYHKGALPNQKKFSVYDAEGKFGNMYTNLNYQHMVLANKEGKTFDDITYGAVDYSYEYPGINNEHYFRVQVEADEKEIIDQLEKINAAIILKSNERFVAKENKDFEFSYTLLHEIKNLRKSYLKLYKTLLSKKKGVDLYSQYKKASELVNSINEKKGIKEPVEFTEIINGIDWYIAINSNMKIVANCLPGAEATLKRRLEELKEMRPNLTEQLSESEVSNGFRL